MKEYTCEWTVSVPARSPQAAVEKARTIQLDWKNTANHFSVYLDDDGTDMGQDEGHIGDFNSNLYPVKDSELLKAIHAVWDALSDFVEEPTIPGNRHMQKAGVKAIAKLQKALPLALHETMKGR